MQMTKEEQYKSRKQRRIDVACDGVERVTLSFYKYTTISDPQAMRDTLFEDWYAMGCLGRIYVAHEGINAQMNVPKSKWEQFDQYVQAIPEFTGVPYKIAVEQDNTSFFKLTIKVKNKIVADGLDDAQFDPSNTGDYLTATEMNQYIEDPDAVVIDMRNAYEAEVGHFESAQIMDVDTFRDQLATVEEQFSGQKDKKIALYCTGGIRCEKASAWMKHKGFSDVHHVKGGIIDYAHQVKEQGIENKFKGKNFVFDERMGERVGDEIISTCHLCEKTAADDYYHCKHQACHVLFIGCDPCMNRKKGYCGFKCRAMDKLPKPVIKKLSRRHAESAQAVSFQKNRMKRKSA